MVEFQILNPRGQAWTEEFQNQEFADLFEYFDKTRDGRITFDEFHEVAVQLLDYKNTDTGENLRHMFQEVDVDGNNWIDKSEFINLCKKIEALADSGFNSSKPGRLHLKTKLDLLKMFRRYDVDKSGFIEFHEFRNVIKDTTGNESMTYQELQARFRNCDTN